MDLFLAVLIWFVSGSLMAAGLLGSVVPGLPGPPLVFIGAFFFALTTGFIPVGWPVLMGLGILAALSQVFDYLAAAWGARRFGGGAAGVWGSILGGVAGLLIFSLPGMLIGVFAGAVALETLFGKKKPLAALRVGGGSLIGFLGGTLMKVVFSAVMIGIFLYAVLGG